MKPAFDLVLRVAFNHRVAAPTIEEAYSVFSTLSQHALSYEEFFSAVAAFVSEGLIHEPVRLPEGALQCHWHLELTPKGVEVSRALLSDTMD